MSWHTGQCPHFDNGTCGVASAIVGAPVPVLAESCAACGEMPEPAVDRPNEVVFGIAALQMHKTGDARVEQFAKRFGGTLSDTRPFMTFGFATRDDYDGAWMTINSMLAHHPRAMEDAEIVVIDNSPDGSEHATLLEKHTGDLEKVRYIRATGDQSSCSWKGQLFNESRGEFVLCCDSHVIFEYGALDALVDYYRRNPDCSDLISGPAYAKTGRLIGTQQNTRASSMSPEMREAYGKTDKRRQITKDGSLWAGGALGVWAIDERGVDVSGEVYEIDQQGTGCFSCRREAWPGFMPGMNGHGGNETYLMERFRERGDRVVCLPALRWIHRFGNPRDGRYPQNWEHRVGNYLRGFADLDRPDLYDGAIEHLSTTCPKTLKKVSRTIPRPPGLWDQLTAKWFTRPGLKGGAIPKALFHEIRRVCQPGFRTLEFGSGLSTLLFNELGTHHEAIEHDAAWVERVKPLVRKGLPVTHCAIKDGWYDWKLKKGRQYDVILIDGPPARIGREGCLDLFPDILRPGGTVLVDDTHREKDERLAEQIAERLEARLVTRKWGKRRFAVITTQPSEADKGKIAQPDEFPCIHRGKLIEWRQCKPCRNGIDRLPVYECSWHDECVVRGDVRRAKASDGRCKSCAVCEDRQYGEQPKPKLTGGELLPPKQRARRPLEFVVVSPTLGMGGAEQWIRSMIEASDPEQVGWKVVLTAPEHWHELIVSRINKCENATLYVAGSHGLRGYPAHRHQGITAAIEAACQDADSLVAWGSGRFWPIPNDVPSCIVGQGMCRYTIAVIKDAFDRGCKHMVAVSQMAAKTAPEGVTPTIIWNGADTARLKVTRTPNSIHQNEWNVSPTYWTPEFVYVGSMGRLSMEKNCLATAQAVATLPWQYRCVQIGTVGFDSGEMIPELKRVAGEKLVLVDNVDQVGNHLNAMDVFVLASHREGNSLAICEAMLVGVPIVCTQVGAVPEFERIAGCELFWKLPEDPTSQEVAEAIRTAAKAGKRSDRVQAAQRFAQANLTTRQMAKNWTGYLERLAKGEV